MNTIITIEIEITPWQVEVIGSIGLDDELKKAAQKRLAELLIEELSPTE